MSDTDAFEIKLYKRALMRMIDDAQVLLANGKQYNDGSLFDEGYVAGVQAVVAKIEAIEYQLDETLSQATNY